MTALELFRIVSAARQTRGWGRALRSLVAGWYRDRPVAKVAADVLKCPGDGGWTHRDLLRMAHPAPHNNAQGALFQWIAEGRPGHLATPELLAGELRQLNAVHRLDGTIEEAEAVRLVEQYSLTHEMIPEAWRTSAAVWETLLTDMTYSGIVLTLTELADAGVLVESSPAAALIVARLIDRRRAANSGLDTQTIAQARDRYAAHARAIPLVVAALDSAVDLVTL